MACGSNAAKHRFHICQKVVTEQHAADELVLASQLQLRACADTSIRCNWGWEDNVRENRILRAAAIVSLIGLTGCVQTVIHQSVNAPSECGNLIGEYARRSFAFNAKGRAINEERARSGRSCPDSRRLREQIADLGPIIAVMEKMDAKGCYQRPVGPLSRNALTQLKARLAYCEAQVAR